MHIDDSPHPDSPGYGFQPIGFVRCAQQYPYEVPRQAILADNEARIELRDDDRLRQGLQGLADFERIWVISVFDRNDNWRPLVQPPAAGVGRFGVFATRSPHRPNPLGLSCVVLAAIENLTLHIRHHDLLDGTPVLDLKPYIPYADAFPEAKAGWTEERDEPHYTIELADLASRQAAWIRREAGLDIHGFIQAQLGTGPLNAGRKRIQPTAAGHLIAYRTWRLLYTVDTSALTVTVHEIHSGYTTEELADPHDPYQDKRRHLAFRERWPESEKNDWR